MATASSTLVKLPASVDLDAIESVRENLLEALEAGPVTISGADVERVSTNALLMLVSAAETARRNSFAFAIADVSAPMEAAIDRLGLGSLCAAGSEGRPAAHLCRAAAARPEDRSGLPAQSGKGRAQPVTVQSGARAALSF